jgi:hypothetical protein
LPRAVKQAAWVGSCTGARRGFLMIIFPLMRVGRRIWCTTLALVALSCLSCSWGRQGGFSQEDQSYRDLKLRIDLEKECYLLDEPIWVDATLTNVGQDTVWLPLPPQILLRTIKLNVVRIGADSLANKGAYEIRMRERHPVAPGQGLTDSFDILDYYCSKAEKFTRPGSDLPVGIYSVRGESFGAITSRDVLFEIIEPTGRNLAIHQAMRRADRLSHEYHRQQAVASLESVLPMLEGSPYKEKVLYKLGGLWNKFEREREVEAYRDLIELNPDTRYASHIVKQIMYEMSRSEAESFVQGLESAPPNSRGALAAREAMSSKWMPWNRQH